MKIQCGNCFEEYDQYLGVCPSCGFAGGDLEHEAFALFPGTIISGRYQIGRMMGLGGFGITYKARDLQLDTTVAIKEYYPSGLVNRQPGETDVILVASRREREFQYGKDRFLEEARNMAKFSGHKHIVNVFQFFEANNTAYIVMEFLDGMTLSQTLRSKNAPLPSEYGVNVALGVCQALKAIHREDILHRDVSPDNIMICHDGTIKLFDFGAARFSASVKSWVTVVIKPGFAPPEQYDKVNRQDARTDIYALGATLYYAITGVRPEESTNRKIEDTLVEPHLLVDSIPENISTIIMRAMAVEQLYRFSTVEELENALQGGKRVDSVQKQRAKRNRRRFMGIIMSLLVVVGAAGVFLYLFNSQRATAELPDADLEIWYMETGDDEADSAKAEALAAILDTFTDEYSNVTVRLTAVEQESYVAALTEASTNHESPDVFESTGLLSAELGSVISFSEAFRELSSDLYYTERLVEESKYPAGIVVPVIYVNVAIGTLESAESVDDLISACNEFNADLVMKESAVELYAPHYGSDLSGYVSASALDAFCAQDAFLYLGDSSDYFAVQSSLPGGYALLTPNTGVSTYQYGSTWSVSSSDSDTEEAAIALTSYFSSNLSQDYFHIQFQSGELPILRSTLADLLSIYDELSIVETYLSYPASAKPQSGL